MVGVSLRRAKDISGLVLLCVTILLKGVLMFERLARTGCGAFAGIRTGAKTAESGFLLSFPGSSAVLMAL